MAATERSFRPERSTLNHIISSGLSCRLCGTDACATAVVVLSRHLDVSVDAPVGRPRVLHDPIVTARRIHVASSIGARGCGQPAAGPGKSVPQLHRRARVGSALQLLLDRHSTWILTRVASLFCSILSHSLSLSLSLSLSSVCGSWWSEAAHHSPAGCS
jgi:hypothetical protein